MVKLIFRSALILLVFHSAALCANDETRLIKTIKKDYSLPANGYVELINKYGQIVINPWAKDSVRVEVKITAHGKDREDAEKLLERVEVDFRHTSPYLSMETVLDRKSGFFKEVWNNISDYSKTLLSKNKIEIDFEISLPATASLDIENKFGNIYIREFEGKCNINLAHGDLRANKFFASSNIEVGYGNVRIKELMKGTLSLKGTETEIAKLGDIEIKSSSSTVLIKEAGDIRLDSRGDQQIRFNSLKSLKGKSTFSKIDVEAIEKSVSLDMTYGYVNIQSIPFSFDQIDIEGKYTDVHLHFMPGTYLLVDITGKEDEITLPVADVKLDKQYTDEKQRFVQVKGSIGAKTNYPGSVNINTNGGEIVVEVPAAQQSANK